MQIGSKRPIGAAMQKEMRAKKMLRAAALLVCAGMSSARMLTLDELPVDEVFSMTPGLDASGKSFSTTSGCADGSAFNFLVRKGTTNVNRVLIDFMGGGACWGDRCFENDSKMFQTGKGFWSLLSNYKTDQVPALFQKMAGSQSVTPPIAFGTDIADIKTWTYIFVPVCTHP